VTKRRHVRPRGMERNDMQPWEGYSPTEVTPGGRVPFPTPNEPIILEPEVKPGKSYKRRLKIRGTRSKPT